jgi:cation diffusion facilitator family transporter
MAGGEGVGYIFRALIANGAIAAAKGVGAFITGSGAMLAETLHSLSDCANQVLLLVGLKKSKRPPTAQYPLGHGRQLYFYSFLVAILLFLGGGAYSIYEGIHKLRHPSDVESPYVAIGILAFGLVIELWSMAGAVKAVNERRGSRSLVQYLRESKDSDLVVIFGEDLAACLGLAVALVAVGIAWATGDGMWDAIGTLGIGAVLIGIAIFLAVEVKSLLLGESADSALTEKIEAICRRDPNVVNVLQTITVQQGPGEILVAMKLHFKPELTCDTVVRVINDIEAALRAAMPELKWCFLEPDMPPIDSKYTTGAAQRGSAP